VVVAEQVGRLPDNRTHVARYGLLALPSRKYVYYWNVGVNLPNHDLTLIVDSNLKRPVVKRIAVQLAQGTAHQPVHRSLDVVPSPVSYP
jgi:hypothetical protein